MKERIIQNRQLIELIIAEIAVLCLLYWLTRSDYAWVLRYFYFF